MRFAASIFVVLLSVAASAWGQDQAFTNRATELKEKGDAQSKTVASLAENTAVKVLGRGGAYTQVEANGQKGWVRAFHLRFPATIEKSESGGGLSSLTSIFGGSREQKQATIGTTGIRGLSPEDLKNAAPDAAALAKAQSYRSDKPTAERFAREGKLADVKVDYQEGGRK